MWHGARRRGRFGFGDNCFGFRLGLWLRLRSSWRRSGRRGRRDGFRLGSAGLSHGSRDRRCDRLHGRRGRRSRHWCSRCRRDGSLCDGRRGSGVRCSRRFGRSLSKADQDLLGDFLDRAHHKQRLPADDADTGLPVLGRAQPRHVRGHDEVVPPARFELDELHDRVFPEQRPDCTGNQPGGLRA